MSARQSICQLTVVFSLITAIPDTTNYVKVCEAVQVLCSMSLATIQACVEAWHQIHHPRMKTCQTPSDCPSYKKPTTKSGACQACIDWGRALESECYPPGKDIQWKNVNTTLLHKDPMEAAKGFVFIIPDKQSCKEFDDFDVGGTLKLMMGFADYHGGDQICHDKMQKVQAIKRTKIFFIRIGYFHFSRLKLKKIKHTFVLFVYVEGAKINVQLNIIKQCMNKGIEINGSQVPNCT